MAYLTGYYENFVDEKGRTILPKEFKEQIGTEVVVTRGLDDCVFVLPPQSWFELKTKLAALPMSKGRDVNLFFNTHQKTVNLDKQGRVQLPQKLREIAAIEGKAVIIGNGNRVEIWNPERYAKMDAELDSGSIMAAMDELGF